MVMSLTKIFNFKGRKCIFSTLRKGQNIKQFFAIDLYTFPNMPSVNLFLCCIASTCHFTKFFSTLYSELILIRSLPNFGKKIEFNLYFKAIINLIYFVNIKNSLNCMESSWCYVILSTCHFTKFLGIFCIILSRGQWYNTFYLCKFTSFRRQNCHSVL